MNLCSDCFEEFERWTNRVEPMGCKGIGGTNRTVETNMELGRGGRPNISNRGLRRAAFDAAFGYVSGFRKRDIAYWVLTRSLSMRVYRQVLKVEAHYGSKDARDILAGGGA